MQLKSIEASQPDLWVHILKCSTAYIFKSVQTSTFRQFQKATENSVRAGDKNIKAMLSVVAHTSTPHTQKSKAEGGSQLEASLGYTGRHCPQSWKKKGKREKKGRREGHGDRGTEGHRKTKLTRAQRSWTAWPSLHSELAADKAVCRTLELDFKLDRSQLPFGSYAMIERFL